MESLRLILLDPIAVGSLTGTAGNMKEGWEERLKPAVEGRRPLGEVSAPGWRDTIFFWWADFAICSSISISSKLESRGVIFFKEVFLGLVGEGKGPSELPEERIEETLKVGCMVCTLTRRVFLERAEGEEPAWRAEPLRRF